MRSARGFTLIEILIALGVFAVVSISIHGRSGDVIRQLSTLESRTLATWVARNRLTELELEFRETDAPVPVGRDASRTRLGGRDWRIETEISATGDDALRRVEIRVRAGENAPVGADDGVAARLVGFIGRT